MSKFWYFSINHMCDITVGILVTIFKWKFKPGDSCVFMRNNQYVLIWIFTVLLKLCSNIHLALGFLCYITNLHNLGFLNNNYLLKVKWKWKSLSSVQIFVIPWPIQYMEFSRPEYWSGQPFPSPGNLPDPGIEMGSPALQADSLPTELSEEPNYLLCHRMCG